MNSAIGLPWKMQFMTISNPQESSRSIGSQNFNVRRSKADYSSGNEGKSRNAKRGGGEEGNRNRGRPNIKSYGSSRRSRIRKSFVQEQVKFTTPLSDDPHVAILGGGMSGLICALTLEQRGIRSTVFDTGMHGLGGRMGTRQIDPYPLIFDHAAQFFTASDPKFKKLVDGWISEGVVREWKGQLSKLRPGGQVTPLPQAVRYIGTNGMRPLADSILSQVANGTDSKARTLPITLSFSKKSCEKIDFVSSLEKSCRSSLEKSGKIWILSLYFLKRDIFDLLHLVIDEIFEIHLVEMMAYNRAFEKLPSQEIWGLLFAV